MAWVGLGTDAHQLQSQQLLLRSNGLSWARTHTSCCQRWWVGLTRCFLSRLLSWWLLDPEHTLAVTIAGALWVWGLGSHDQLGLGDPDNRLVPTLVRGCKCSDSLLTVACSNAHKLTVTKDGALWTFGQGRDGKLCHTDERERLVLTRINAQHFGNAKIV